MNINNKDSKRIIIALDFPDAESTRKLLRELDPAQCRVKIGKELFTRCGPSLVEEVVKSGFDLFLDLKFHDIPNTVGKAVAAAANLGVWMTNVHAAGGRDMMIAAKAAVDDAQHKPLLIAVTVLTSMSQTDLLDIGITMPPQEQVMRLARLAGQCGMDGVVCSAAETQMLRVSMGGDFVLVTPGIRPAGDAPNDQKRIVTPVDAIRAGSSYLVIGRPVTQAAKPGDKLNEIFMQLHGSFPDLC
ncbi:MAG: orotidine-5'-phosphate decarboxylase [Gammaproteobacteria bacterium]|nr:orotidine-5'-phosphate decarboxylase [Gammaproteobacteria bacterium]MDP2140898.1 orotidine-5'-phosphate decarboxylase [Gammaproteobacteria bacterium]MDP2349358.1 orotidine-5'-phosphate decarboxylase [Gammaproteobacteria bacterium]